MNTTETFVLFYRDFTTTTSASIWTNVCSPGPRSVSMATSSAPVVSNLIHNASLLQNASDVKSLLGMTQYVSRFIPNYATIAAPLHFLTRQDTHWKWEQEEQKTV